MNYVPLNVKTTYTFLNSLVDIKELVQTCIKYGINSVAIADKNSMSGVMEFYLECTNNNIKPIIGVELEIEDYSILLYAKNNNGYKELIKLTTLSSERQIEQKDLLSSKDIVVILNSSSYNKYNELKKIYNDLYIGYLTLTERKEYLKLTNNLVFVQEVLCLEEENLKYLGYLSLIEKQKKINEYDSKQKHNCLLKSIDIPITDKNNMINISSMCNVKLEFSDNLLPIYDKINNMDEYLTTMANKGLYKRLNGKINDIYQSRLNYELDIIKKMGFTNYFLIVWDYVCYAKKNGILVGPGRGSAVSSLVSYCLGIIDIDPIKYNLLFERFLNPGRITMPDIDIDFEDTKRDNVISYCYKKYGIKNVAKIVTFQTLGAKASIRDIGRIFDTPIKLIDGMVSFITNPKDSLTKLYSNNKDFKKYIIDNNLYEIYDIASHVEGIKRQRSVHASAIVISNKELDSMMSLIKHDDMYITGYPANYLEQMGLLKMDFLGVTNLSLISRLIKTINEKENKDITFNNIPLEDDLTIELFKNGDTLGIFQFESEGMRNFLRKLKVNNFEDIICAISLFRPGPAMFIDKYISLRKSNNVKYIDKSFEEILGVTYGIIVYQEQILRIANVMAGYSLMEADILRSAMSKKKYEVLEREKPKFISGCIKRGYDEKIALEVFNNILKFSSYGFNRAHAVAYSVVAFKMAYLKAHYKKYFFIELLNNTTLKLKDCIYECKKNNIEFLKPSINRSSEIFTLCDSNIIYPFNNINGISKSIINNIMEERQKGLFTSFIDFVIRCYSNIIDKSILECLIDASCFDDFPYNKKTLHNNLDVIINYAKLVSEIGHEYVDEPIIEIEEEYSNEELLEKELNVFGFYFGNHPVIKYKNDNCIDIKNVKKYLDKTVNIVGMIDTIKEISTKKQEKMAFIKLCDEEDNIDSILFPKTYIKFNNLKRNDIIQIQGKVERRFEKYQLVVDNIKILKN